MGLSVSIWNHTATLELLAELERAWQANKAPRPVIVLGGPEVSHLPPDAAIFRHADYVIRGEGEIAFRTLCERILETGPHKPAGQCIVIDAVPVNVAEIKKCSHGGQGPGNNPRKRAFSPFPDPQKNTPEYSI